MWGALASSAASVYGAWLQSNAASRANQANIDQQDKANAMTIDLSNTSHQREVNDLRAANLNPILSAGGNGASSPTLGSATVQNTGSDFGNSARAVGASFQRALNTAQRLENHRTAAEVDNLHVQNGNLFEDNKLKQAQVDQIEQETRKAKADADFAEAKAALAQPVKQGITGLESSAKHIGAAVGEAIGNKVSSAASSQSSGNWQFFDPAIGRYIDWSKALEKYGDKAFEMHEESLKRRSKVK